MQLETVYGIVRGVDGMGVPDCSIGATSRTVSVPEMASISDDDGTWGWTLKPDALYEFEATCHGEDSSVLRGHVEAMIQSGRKNDLIEIVVR